MVAHAHIDPATLKEFRRAIALAEKKTRRDITDSVGFGTAMFIKSAKAASKPSTKKSSKFRELIPNPDPKGSKYLIIWKRQDEPDIKIPTDVGPAGRKPRTSGPRVKKTATSKAGAKRKRTVTPKRSTGKRKTVADNHGPIGKVGHYGAARDSWGSMSKFIGKYGRAIQRGPIKNRRNAKLVKKWTKTTARLNRRSPSVELWNKLTYQTTKWPNLQNIALSNATKKMIFLINKRKSKWFK